jgi:hypothetical protein
MVILLLNQIKLIQLNSLINILFNAIILKIYFDQDRLSRSPLYLFSLSLLFLFEKEKVQERYFEKTKIRPLFVHLFSLHQIISLSLSGLSASVSCGLLSFK